MQLYVVMWEEYDGYQCTGADMFYTLDPDKASEFLHDHHKVTHLTWNADTGMYIHQSKYAWEKMYIDVRALDEEV